MKILEFNTNIIYKKNFIKKTDKIIKIINK